MTKKKILVVDDEKAFTKMVKLNLESTGNYEVKIENDSTMAVKTALEFRPHLILLDVIMPEVEGPDVVYQLRQNDLLRGIPIVFLTATVTHQEVEAQEGYIGGHAFLAKPGTVGELVKCIERHLPSH